MQQAAGYREETIIADNAFACAIFKAKQSLTTIGAEKCNEIIDRPIELGKDAFTNKIMFRDHN